MYGCETKKKKKTLTTPVAKKIRKRPASLSLTNSSSQKKPLVVLKAESTKQTKMKTLLKKFSQFPSLGISSWTLNNALKHLAKVEPKFQVLFETHGVPKDIQVRLKQGDLGQDSTTAFHSLCRTIIYQQLAGKAAATIYNKVHTECLGLEENEMITPEHILNGNWEERDVHGSRKQFLNKKRCGLSKGKRKYIQSLAQHFNDPSKLKGVDLHDLPDDELRKRLTDIQGLGHWSVDMFMLFKLKRPDIMPTKDLAVRKGVARFYGKNEKAFCKDSKNIRDQVNELTSHWAPYRSLGCLYMYHLMDIKDTGN